MSNDKMTMEKLRSIYGEVHGKAAAKVISRFDDHCRQFIEHSTFLVLATTDTTSLDISPKGDPAGFVEVESDTTLLLPDRPGNNRIDGLLNIVENPLVALLFLIPTVDETLRVNGKAEITDDPAICDRFAVNGRAPKTVTRITATEIYTHCGKAPLRGGLWTPSKWPNSRPVPTLLEMLRDHTATPIEDAGQEAVDEIYRNSMY